MPAVSPPRLARGQLDLSLNLAVLHVLESVGRALQGIGCAHQRLDLLGAQPRRQLPQVRRIEIALALGELAPENAHDRAALEHPPPPPHLVVLPPTHPSPPLPPPLS